MSDETPEPIPNVMPIQKTSAFIGDGIGRIFAVEHPAAPNVTWALYRMSDGQTVDNLPGYEVGRIIFAFATPPAEREFVAVVIG